MEPLNQYLNTNSKFKAIDAPWFQNKCFKRYWEIYNRCMVYTHVDVLSRCYETKNNLAATLYKMVKAPWPEEFSEFQDKKYKIGKKQRKRNRKRRNNRAKVEEKKASEQSVFVLTDDDTLQVQLQEQMKIEESSDVDDDYLKFMKASVIHRIKWNEVKENKDKKHSNQSSIENSSAEQEEHPDVARERELNELYGESSAQIHGMETAMQLSFDRISTLHQPTIWPNIPLKLSF